MLKKLIRTMFLAAAALFICTACGEKSNAKTFTVGFDADFPPYGFKAPDGTYTGFDLELAAEVAKRNGWELVLKPINWDAKDMELNTDSIDCIWNGFTINGREDKYEWTKPYVDNSQVVMVMKASTIVKLADLAGKTVAVQTDTPVQKALIEKGKKEELGKTFKKLVVTPTYNNAVMELEAGSVDAVAMDIGVANEKLKSGNFRILDEIVITEQYGVGFKKGNTALRDTVQKTLLDMVADGSAAKISAKYFKGKDVLIIGK